MSYRHLTITERIKIETYLELGLKPIPIARKLGVHKSTLSRELRPCNDTCFAQVAQTHYEKLTKQKGRKSSWAPELMNDYNLHCLQNKFVGLINLKINPWCPSKPFITGFMQGGLTLVYRF